MRTWASLSLLVLLASCASIVSKSVYPVTIETNPTGATLSIRDDAGSPIYEGPAPTTLTLDASDGYFSGARYLVEATLPGHNVGRAVLRAGLDGWYIGNIVFGGLIGFLIVDPATGAMWQLDSRLTVNLTAEKNGGS